MRGEEQGFQTLQWKKSLSNTVPIYQHIVLWCCRCVACSGTIGTLFTLLTNVPNSDFLLKYFWGVFTWFGSYQTLVKNIKKWCYTELHILNTLSFLFQVVSICSANAQSLCNETFHMMASFMYSNEDPHYFLETWQRFCMFKCFLHVFCLTKHL